MGFPEPEQWNGSDMRPIGSADGTPTIYRCLTCGHRFHGSIARADHVSVTGHTLIVPKADLRFTQPATDHEVA